jgi:hypothetical protein
MFVVYSHSDMSLIDDINGDFPYQVALSFDEETVGVLEWLDADARPWDMYVDLPANTVRYCFHNLADASAFRGKFGQINELRRTVAGGR